jgi:hypothetical protein
LRKTPTISFDSVSSKLSAEAYPGPSREVPVTLSGVANGS